jgi:hypothetical protein
MDTFSFAANAGDTILLSLSRLSGDLWQQLRLYDPDGNLLNEQSHPVHTELAASLPATGDYTILVADGFDGTLTGAYNLFMQRLNDPANAPSLSFGQIKPGTMQQPAEMDTYTIEADAGDAIFLGMSRISGDLWQEIRLYDPHGSLLSEVSSPVHVEDTYTVAASGEYRILLTDGFDGTNTGSYNLYVQRLNNPSGATALPVGQMVAGSILQPAEVDTYRFSAQVNDTIRIQMTRVSGTLWQQIRLCDPDGNLIGENEGVTQAEMTRSLPVTGEYTVLASDGFDGTLTGGLYPRSGTASMSSDLKGSTQFSGPHRT